MISLRVEALHLVNKSQIESPLGISQENTN